MQCWSEGGGDRVVQQREEEETMQFPLSVGLIAEETVQYWARGARGDTEVTTRRRRSQCSSRQSAV